MDSTTLYSDALWQRYCEKIAKTAKDYKLKTYPQLDTPFNFFNNKEIIQSLVSDSSLKSIARHSFLPFVKILSKTPRYRYQESEGVYQLETKIRPISFAAHLDTYIYGYYSFALTELYQSYIKEEGFDKCVLAYRTDLEGKSNIQFAKEVFDYIRSKLTLHDECSALAFDITGYFDNINHEKLKEKWCKVLKRDELPVDQYKVFRSLTKYSYISKDNFLKHYSINITGKKWSCLLDLMDDSIAGSSMLNKLKHLRKEELIVTNIPKIDDKGNKSFRGIPQGSSMSALLSNIYLIDFDSWLYDLSKKYNFLYKRYCDDLLVVCEKEYSEELANKIIEEIKKYDLVIQPKKTEVFKFQRNSKGKMRCFNISKLKKDNTTISSLNEHKYYKNLQYLGFEFNGQNIYIRPSSLSRYFRKMKGRIVKTIMMAYSDHSKKDIITKKQIFKKYSHLGRRNFLSYAYKAASKTYTNREGIVREGLDSNSIKKQLSSHFSFIEREIFETSHQRFDQKENRRLARLTKGKRTKYTMFKK